MNFENWLKLNTRKLDRIIEDYPTQRSIAMKSWNACKKEVLKILENEIDNGDCSIATATPKIRDEI